MDSVSPATGENVAGLDVAVPGSAFTLKKFAFSGVGEKMLV